MSTLFDIYGYLDREDCLWRLGEAWEANALLSRHHYLGPLHSGARLTIICQRDGEPVAAMMWKHPTSRGLPADGSWLELSRWCLTPAAGDNAGSRMHKWSTRLIREHLPEVTTLVSYSDPSHGHTGSLYRACNWRWAPTWHRLRPPPSGNGDWGTGPQSVKDRWVFALRRDDRRSLLAVEDGGAIRHWQENATDTERRWAALSEHMQYGDVIPRDLAPVELDAAPMEAGDRALRLVRSDGPAEQRAEHGLRVRLAPSEFHDDDSSEVPA